MSLRVWLPLNGTLENKGLDNVTVTNNGATVDNNGKIGKCYSFDGSDDFISLNGSCLYNIIKGGSQPFSISFWVYQADSTRAIIFGDYSLTGGIGFNIELTAGHVVRFYWNGSPDLNISQLNVGTTTWNHVALVYDTTHLYGYLNGNLVYTYTGTLTAKNKTSGDYYLGRDNRTGSTALYGKLNDVRIYDHALSPLEVKQISQGLILHYPLNRNGWGQENLYNFRSYANSWTMEGLDGVDYTDSSYGNVIKLTTSAANQRTYHGVSAVWQKDQVYTVSFLAKADTNGRTCDMSRSLADFSPTFTLTTDWKRYSGKITSTTTSRGGTLSFRVNQSAATVYITQIKLEKGEIVTPYCPYSTDPDYNVFGLNSTTEYDCSGFCNNGTRTGTFSWTSDTPKYCISTKFPASPYITSNNIIGGGLKTMTMACWIKPTTLDSTWRRICGIGAHTRVHLDVAKSNKVRFLVSLDGTTGTYIAAISSTILTTNTWYHVCGVLDENVVKIYINGELQTTSGTGTITYTNADIFRVGTISSGSLFDGQISDVRIYATALSAEDVKSLYNNSAYIDNQGNIYGAVYEEV